ncbi:MAG: histidine kinase [Burkholderiaceae bacterium]|nr:histidine kinase [Burkholderiaceae bacterium]
MPHFELRPFARHGLITAVLCCLIALALTLSKNGAWDVQLAYSLGIGLCSWLVIELGRHWLRGPGDIPWPMGWRGIALIVCGISVGFVLGTALGDAYSGTATGLLRGHDAVPSLLITVAASVAISFFFYSRGRAAYLQAHMAQAQRDATEARLKLLEAQLEPHMMFNTLANLRVLIATDPPRAQAMLDHLIAYLRATLGGARTTVHPLADEFARLADYLEIMAVRMGPRLTFSLDLPEALQGTPVPPLLLQPLVENAIRHGLEPQVNGGHIQVRASTLPGPAGALLALEVVDTGVGLAQPPAAPADGPASHFGLAQVRERLATLYGPQGTLELIAVTAGGTSARVTFPLNFPAA